MRFVKQVNAMTARANTCAGDVKPVYVPSQQCLGKDYPGQSEERRHYHRPLTRPFNRGERAQTTILIDGLTSVHQRLAAAAMRSLGYSCEALPTPDVHAYQTGKEFQNNGYCNPAYFMVGNLIKYLQSLEANGLSRQEIIDRYVFVTAGSCGTCRFGMYEEEYQLALRNAGFGGFRILTFGIDRGPEQGEDGAGLEVNLDFFLALATALNLGDILNQLACQIRPYEVAPGKTDEVLERVMAMVADLLETRRPYVPPAVWRKTFGAIGLGAPFVSAAKVVRQLLSRDLVDAMTRACAEFDTIEIDHMRVRPIVRVIGEFWAQTTDGDGNFRMVRFLEGERAEAYVDRMIGTRLMYLFHKAKQMAREKKGIGASGKALSIRQPRALLWQRMAHFRKLGLLTMAEKLYKRENDRLLRALNGTLHEIVDQRDFLNLAAPYYEWRCASGEGHLEIAENIYYQTHNLCHMVLSLKPFGCMPSTQSDGAQAAVLEDYNDLIYLPIETSGDSEILAYSRVQMALGGARAKARKELISTLTETGLSLQKVRAYIDAHPELKRPMYRVPSQNGIVGRAALLALHVSQLMKSESGSAHPGVARAPRAILKGCADYE